MASGIYKIMNHVDSKAYIGSSVNLTARKAQHFKLLREGIHYNTHLQNSYNLHGKENFEFIIIEICCPQNLIIKEQFWIDFYKKKE